ncbi:hypothetical protein [Halosimplex halobium]|uniref:hypothetical protein n=1 Tax=Halosimplex halobium TaxID=3396618 RepID=UPI003F560962
MVDTNLFVRFERYDTVDLLRRAVAEYDITLHIPPRVYEELTPDFHPYDVPPVKRAIEDGWVEVTDEVDYSNPVVSATMDMVRKYIATADERPEHEIEQADAALGGVTATLLEHGTAESVAIYTNDIPAFRGLERALSEHGYESHVQLVKAFEFAQTIEDRYQFSE